MAMNVKDRDVSAIVTAAIEKHGAQPDALIPILSEVNNACGFIPKEAFAEISRQVQAPEHNVFVSESQLYAVATFYHMLSTRPLGKHVVRFCESAPCHVMGGRQVLQALMDALELQPGETSPDQQWSFITTSCLGVCGVGPVFLVDEDIYGNVTPDQVRGILARYD